jgi:hypothetical protein
MYMSLIFRRRARTFTWWVQADVVIGCQERLEGKESESSGRLCPTARDRCESRYEEAGAASQCYVPWDNRARKVLKSKVLKKNIYSLASQQHTHTAKGEVAVARTEAIYLRNRVIWG